MEKNFQVFFDYFIRSQCPELFTFVGDIPDFIFFNSIEKLVDKIQFDNDNVLGFGYEMVEKDLKYLNVCSNKTVSTQYPENSRTFRNNIFSSLEAEEKLFKEYVRENLLVHLFDLKKPKIFYQFYGNYKLEMILLKPTNMTITSIQTIKTIESERVRGNEFYVVLKNQSEQAKRFLLYKKEDYLDFIPVIKSSNINRKSKTVSVGTQTSHFYQTELDYHFSTNKTYLSDIIVFDDFYRRNITLLSENSHNLIFLDSKIFLNKRFVIENFEFLMSIRHGYVNFSNLNEHVLDKRYSYILYNPNLKFFKKLIKSYVLSIDLDNSFVAGPHLYKKKQGQTPLNIDFYFIEEINIFVLSDEPSLYVDIYGDPINVYFANGSEIMEFVILKKGENARECFIILSISSREVNMFELSDYYFIDMYKIFYSFKENKIFLTAKMLERMIFLNYDYSLNIEFNDLKPQKKNFLKKILLNDSVLVEKERESLIRYIEMVSRGFFNSSEMDEIEKIIDFFKSYLKDYFDKTSVRIL
ncbi:unnamed protein product [Brachionus calyciflorus]|uniref:Uncharacterized protein n=1 Tax=Brachionus calyciflorus TaxID=104777 RepID=A0A814BXT1_9BILA|nr:unnamed protein product [Brachionus calyciflorus]